MTRILAARLNGLDLSLVRVGDIVELPALWAEMLVAERWAEPAFDARLDPYRASPAPGHSLNNDGYAKNSQKPLGLIEKVADQVAPG